MWSFKASGQPSGPARRRGAKGLRRRNALYVEGLELEARMVLTLAPPTITSVRLESGPGTDTNNTRPVLVGQVHAVFPGSAAGLTVLAQFNGLHGGSLDLAPLNG